MANRRLRHVAACESVIALRGEARSFLMSVWVPDARGLGSRLVFAESFPPTGSTSLEKDGVDMVDRKKAFKRRDATGHLDAEYERKLRAASQPPRDDGIAFLTGFRTAEPFDEELGEAFLQSA